MTSHLCVSCYELGLRVGQSQKCFGAEWEHDALDPGFRQVVLENLGSALHQLRSALSAPSALDRCLQISESLLQEFREFRGQIGEGRFFPTIRNGVDQIDRYITTIPVTQLQHESAALRWYRLGMMLGNCETIYLDSRGQSRVERESTPNAIEQLCREVGIELNVIDPAGFDFSSHEDRIACQWPDNWRAWGFLEVGLNRLKSSVQNCQLAIADAEAPEILNELLQFDENRRIITRTDVNCSTAKLLPRDFKLAKRLHQSSPAYISTEQLRGEWKDIGKRANPQSSTVHEAANELKTKLNMIYVCVENKSNHGYRLTIEPSPPQ